MAIVIAGERSGVGKTTVTLAILSALDKFGFSVQSYKVGPDYIDPMFHRHVTGRPCRNLDPVLTSEAYVQQCFWRHLHGAEAAVVEGVMGLFDGSTGEADWASTAHIARLLDLPVLLVVDCSRLSRSVAALVQGYQTFDPRLRFAGVVLNRVGSDRHLELLQSALKSLELPILGVFRRDDRLTIPDRHLGLIPVQELEQLDGLVDQLAHLGQQSINWAALLPMLRSCPASPLHQPTLPIHQTDRVQVAVAHDPAFNFYYTDNLELLEQLGAELVFWSPLQDGQLPQDTQALYFGGGFPEVFAAALSQNQAARSAVRSAIQAGMPTYAECGGLMYLCHEIVDFEDKSWPMVGILPTTAVMDRRLTLGYRQAIACQDTPLLTKGQRVAGHEFHRSYLTTQPEQPLYQIQSGDWKYQTESVIRPDQSLATPSKVAYDTEGWSLHQLHASYIHLHWGDQPEIPTRFLQAAR